MKVNADLERWWQADVGTGRPARTALEALLSRYREPQRRYHGERHVTHVRRDVAALLVEPSVAGEVLDPIAVRLAAWYHDAIYDTRSATNEADSADLAERELVGLGITAERIVHVRTLVLSTAHHRPASPDEAALLDADLAVLGADPAAYSAYVAGVRWEYRHVSDGDWQVGRTTVLQSFLDRDRIFHTAPMLTRNVIARANLTAELRTLTGHQ